MPVSGAESEALGYRYARRHRLLRINQSLVIGEGHARLLLKSILLMLYIYNVQTMMQLLVLAGGQASASLNSRMRTNTPD